MAAFALSQTCSAFAGKLQISAAAHPAAARGPMAVTCSKAADFRGMSPAELDSEVATIKRSLFDLRMKRATRQEFKSSDFKMLKKKAAVVLTVKREKEIAEGISKRDSRKLNKATSVRGSKF